MSQEIDNQESENETAEAEVVEVSWEDVKETVEIRKMLLEAQQYLSQILLEHEKRKSSLLSNVEELERKLYETATALQQKHAVNPEWTYEFKLPTQEGEKAYFIRKVDS